ncbi:MAG: HDOD domain-containing protein, partial [Clostridia bacterium]|nr:HDOD domain-containing protein [Clostridia bacterium]
DIDRLVEVIQTDLSISYRLFQYINSARFGLRGKIESVHRAATMLGRRNLRLWLQVIILSDMSTSDKAQELVRISVQRGRFLQLLAEEGYTPLGPDSMFLLGFFSMLDAILNQRMEQILEDIPLDIRIKSALTDRSGVHAAWLSVLRDLDSWDWPAVADKAPKLGVPLDLVGMLNLEAWTWMIEVMQGT